MPEGEHVFAAAPRLWEQMRGEFQELSTADADLADEGAVSADELKKVAKWMQHSLTKFGASAAVAEGEELDRGLKPIAEEVIKGFTAVLGTFISAKRGAGPSLLGELHTAGAELSAALDELGKAIGTPEMPVGVGKVLERVKKLERISTHNRAAIMRKLLQNLAQIRDAQRELQEALACEEGEEEDDGFAEFDASLEPEERRVVEALVALTGALVDALKKVTTACVPAKGPDTVTVGVAELEAAVPHSAAAASAVDSLSVASTGGFDAEEFSKSLAEMRGAVNGFLACPAVGDGGELKRALAAAEAASEAAAAEAEEPEVA